MMERRSFLSTIAASIGTLRIPVSASSPTSASPYDDVVVGTDNRRVRHKITEREGEEWSHWRVETLDGREVWSFSERVEHIRHSYASEYHVFLAFEPEDKARRTVEHYLGSGTTRHRTVEQDGHTRIIDIDANTGDIIRQ